MSTKNAIAERQERALPPQETVRAALEKMKPQMQMALPRHLTPDRLVRVAMTAIQQTPKLLECDRRSLFGAIMTCAQLGLEPDGVLGQAYLVPFAGKVQFIPGYRGLISLARNSGEVSSIQAHEVCENDDFEFDFASGELPRHKFDWRNAGNRGEVKAFYAVARFKDGSHHFELMTMEEVIRVRDGSSGWQTAKRYKREAESPWGKHFVEMGKKTVIRRMAKFLPMNVQKAAAMADAYDTGRHAHLDPYGEVSVETAEIAEPAPQIEHVAGGKLERFEQADEPEGPTATDPEEPDPVDHDPETGEVATAPDDGPAIETMERHADFLRHASATIQAAEGMIPLKQLEQGEDMAALRADWPEKAAELVSMIEQKREWLRARK